MRALIGLVILTALVMSSSACTGAKAGTDAPSSFRYVAFDTNSTWHLSVAEYGGRCFFIADTPHGAGVTGPFPCEATP